MSTRAAAVQNASSGHKACQRGFGASRWAAHHLAAYEGESQQRHLHNGGTESDWPAVWRELKQRWLIAQQHDRHAAEVGRLRQQPRYQV